MSVRIESGVYFRNNQEVLDWKESPLKSLTGPVNLVYDANDTLVLKYEVDRVETAESLSFPRRWSHDCLRNGPAD
jgi:hypothetical protein